MVIDFKIPKKFCMKKIISVFGSSTPRPGSTDYEMTRSVGYLLAAAGFVVQTGGYEGLMAAASQGAREAGGHVIGVTSEQIERYRPTTPNLWISEERRYPTLRERQFHLIDHCYGIITMPGGVGTLAEMSLAWSFVQTGEIPPRPIILVGSLWERTLAAFVDRSYVAPAHQALVMIAHTPDEAVQKLMATCE
jgi:hypothetical protein